MTTVAYAAVQRSGLSFPHQLLIEENILLDIEKLTNTVHRHNAKVSIQLGHCGNMAKYSVIGSRPISASTHITSQKGWGKSVIHYLGAAIKQVTY